MAKPAPPVATDDAEIAQKSDAWTDLGLTLPIFVAYHLGVVFLNHEVAPSRIASEPSAARKRAHEGERRWNDTSDWMFMPPARRLR